MILIRREMHRVLRVVKEKVSDKAVKSAEKKFSRISDHADHSREEVIQKMVEKFSKDKDMEEGSLTKEKINEAKKRSSTVRGGIKVYKIEK